jgi:three-Cys-motif partner protein
VDYKYGTKNDEIDEFFRQKRPWSRVKDQILAKYIDAYLRTIQDRGRPILLVDAFAGPGRFGDDSEGSPLIVLNAITKTPKHKVGMSALFADIRKGHRVALESNIAHFIKAGVAEPPLQDCEAALAHALEVGRDRTLFFYLDPFGIADLDFQMLQQVFEQRGAQSTEVLINFSFPTFMRMTGNWSYDESAASIAEKVKASKIETVNRAMGGDYWRSIVEDPALGKCEREDAVVRAYVERVRGFFLFTVSVPVKDQCAQPGVPPDNLAKYHLIFGSLSSKAVRYMNDIAYAALTPYFNQFSEGLLFDLRPERFTASAPSTIKEEIVQALAEQPLARPSIYEAIIPKHFMQYKTMHYRAMIDDLVFKEGRVFPDLKSMKLKTRLNDETLLSTTPWDGGKGP